MYLHDLAGPNDPSLTDPDVLRPVIRMIWGVRHDKFVICVKGRLIFGRVGGGWKDGSAVVGKQGCRVRKRECGTALSRVP